MKLTILALSTIFAVSAFASLPEKLVATCKMTPTQEGTWDSGKEIGLIKIYSSDNGDEGFLRFTISGPATDDAGNKVKLNGSIVDNTQNDGAAFTKNGVSRLYTGIEKSDFPAAAIYLSNANGKVSGLIKLEFFTADLTSCTLK